MITSSIGENIKRIRLELDMTQRQVAEKAGISVPTYSKIESGKVSPNMATLYKISEAFGVEIQDLLIQARGLKAVRFRAKQKMKKRDQVLVKASRWLEDFNFLLQLVDHPIEYTLADLPLELKKTHRNKRPLVAAKRAREIMGLDEEEPIHDITGLFAANGIKILAYSLASKEFFGMSIGESDGGPAIVVNVWERIPVERWIFSAAHELGHLLLHLNAYDVEVTTEDKQQEKEANSFASYFLMPQKGFEKEWGETRGLTLWERILKVKRIYHVSYKTIIYRLRDLNVFDESIWQKTTIFLKSYYQKPKIPQNFEPEGLKKYDFVTDWLERLVRTAVESGEITLSRASEILGISLQKMRETAASWSEEKVAV